MLGEKLGLRGIYWMLFCEIFVKFIQKILLSCIKSEFFDISFKFSSKINLFQIFTNKKLLSSLRHH